MRDRQQEYLDGKLSTTDGTFPKTFDAGVPDPEVGPSGQHKSYWVLSESERAKGFVRPYRDAYKHVGIPGPQFPLRDLTDEEKAKESNSGYVKYEEYPESMRPLCGRFWSQQNLDRIGKGCGAVTTMGRALSETYARDPKFYGSTFCVNCGKHFPVGDSGEFLWMENDGSFIERVGGSEPDPHMLAKIALDKARKVKEQADREFGAAQARLDAARDTAAKARDAYEKAHDAIVNTVEPTP